MNRLVYTKTFLFILLYAFNPAIARQDYIDPSISRFALVIGNGEYQSLSYRDLDNPVSDSKMVSTNLTRLGFKVTHRVDATLESISSGIDELNRNKSGHYRPTVIVYFAGHGIQDQGENYIVPVDSPGILGLRNSALSVDDLIERAHYNGDLPSGYTITIIDACRSGPSATAAGFRKVEPLADTLVVLAAQPGQFAYDGVKGEGSPFTKAFLESLRYPKVNLNTLLQRVTFIVGHDTNHLQHPVQYSSLSQPFYINRGSASEADMMASAAEELYYAGYPADSERLAGSPSLRGNARAYRLRAWIARTNAPGAAGTGNFDPKARAEAIRHLRAARNLEVDYGSDVILAGLLLEDRSNKKQVSEALSILEEHKGKSASNFILGGYYTCYTSNKRKIGLELLESSAESGYIYAMTHLGITLLNSSQIELREKGLYYLRQSAKQGDGNAVYTLASIYFTNNTNKSDLEEFINLVTPSAEQGSIVSMWTMAAFYYLGVGVEKNIGQSQMWLRRLVQQYRFLIRTGIAPDGVKYEIDFINGRITEVTNSKKKFNFREFVTPPSLLNLQSRERCVEA